MDKLKRNKNSILYALQKERWLLAAYDLLMLLLSCTLILVFHPSEDYGFPWSTILIQSGLAIACIFLFRFLFGIYRQIWRYGGQYAYILLIVTDALGTLVYTLLEMLLPVPHITAVRKITICGLQLLLCLTIRIVYQYMYQQTRNGNENRNSALFGFLLKTFGGIAEENTFTVSKKVNIAIIGAGQVGASLAEDIFLNPQASYMVKCFLDDSRSKAGRDLMNIPVLLEKTADKDLLDSYGIQEIVIAVPGMDDAQRNDYYKKYRAMGYGVKLYDYPVTRKIEAGTKRTLREFDIEELLFRSKKSFDYEAIRPYYGNKTILITGAGGSIGSEITRQVAKMGPKKLVLLDNFENGVYDLQMELQRAYKDSLDFSVSITNIVDKKELDKVFRLYGPQIVIHAAAHKHVPLMEDNVCEAIKNNVFGTKNVVDLTKQYQAERFLMVSTDKAVNPTNVMGATKRLCEMIALSESRNQSSTVFSATRFGNVLGSSGSVIPLFRRQIQDGGPVTITDKRIVRYFMTIPEASYLVLTAGALAKNGELFVLDMGNPVRILDLAETMVSLSGLVPYKDIDIVETGLRPGEKLYEELLLDRENIVKTEKEQIYREMEEPISEEELQNKLGLLNTVLESGDEEKAREVLHLVVPTYRKPEDVNRKAAEAKEIRDAGVGKSSR